MKSQERNLNPSRPAKLAMVLYGHEYAHEFRGGSMDFWDHIGPARRDLVRSLLVGIESARPETPAEAGS